MVEPYLTIPQLVAKKTIPCGETKLYELARSGDIPSYRLGNRVLVLETEVHAKIKTFQRKSHFLRRYNGKVEV